MSSSSCTTFNNNAAGGGCASDLITKKKLEQLVKKGNIILDGTQASNKTLRKQINTIRCTRQIDTFGNPVPKSWFGVTITDQEVNSCFPRAVITREFHSRPMYSLGYTMSSGEMHGSALKMEEALLRRSVRHNISCYPISNLSQVE